MCALPKVRLGIHCYNVGTTEEFMFTFHQYNPSIPWLMLFQQ